MSKPTKIGPVTPYEMAGIVRDHLLSARPVCCHFQPRHETDTKGTAILTEDQAGDAHGPTVDRCHWHEWKEGGSLSREGTQVYGWEPLPVRELLHVIMEREAATFVVPVGTFAYAMDVLRALACLPAVRTRSGSSHPPRLAHDTADGKQATP